MKLNQKNELFGNGTQRESLVNLIDNKQNEKQNRKGDSLNRNYLKNNINMRKTKEMFNNINYMEMDSDDDSRVTLKKNINENKGENRDDAIESDSDSIVTIKNNSSVKEIDSDSDIACIAELNSKKQNKFNEKELVNDNISDEQYDYDDNDFIIITNDKQKNKIINNNELNVDISKDSQFDNTKKEQDNNTNNNNVEIMDYEYLRKILDERLKKKTENEKEIKCRKVLKRIRNRERQRKKRAYIINKQRKEKNYEQIKEKIEYNNRVNMGSKFDDINLMSCFILGEKNRHYNEFVDNYADNMMSLNNEIQQARIEGDIKTENEKIQEKRIMCIKKKYIDKYYNFGDNTNYMRRLKGIRIRRTCNKIRKGFSYKEFRKAKKEADNQNKNNNQ